MIPPEHVCACLVTRGDVDMKPIIDSLPYDEVVVWDNSQRTDYKLFGRYMAMLETNKSVIYTQDDDCIIPADVHQELCDAYQPGVLVANMGPDTTREVVYGDSALLGFGSLFDRDMPWRAWARYARYFPIDWEFLTGLGAEFTWPILSLNDRRYLALEWLEEDDGAIFARPNRMSVQDGFYAERDRVMRRAREVAKQLSKERVW